MSNIDLAIIGFGRIGRIHAANIMAAEDISLKMIVDPYLDVNKSLAVQGVKQSKNIDDILDFENIRNIFKVLWATIRVLTLYSIFCIIHFSLNYFIVQF